MEQQTSEGPGCSGQDLTDKMFVFPEETKTAHVKLNTSQCVFNAVTICHRTMTDLQRDHAVFSMATPSAGNAFLTLLDSSSKQMLSPHVQNARVDFQGVDYVPNQWYSVCTTWQRKTGVVQMWVNGRPLVMKYLTEKPVTGPPIIVLGQDQDGYGGGFQKEQCFTGMMTDVHMWDYVLSPCEIQKFMKKQRFTPGNVLDWGALDFEIKGRVLIEDNQDICSD